MDAQIAQGATLLLDPLQLASELPGKVTGPSYNSICIYPKDPGVS